MTSRRLIVFLFLIILYPITLSGQETLGQQNAKHEILLGGGWAKSFEGHIYNIPDGDVKCDPDYSFEFAYHYYLKKNFALGVLLTGFVQKLPEVSGINYERRFVRGTGNLRAFNVGLEGRIIRSHGRIRPYGYLALNRANGFVDIQGRYLAGYEGTTFGCGFGANWILNNHFALGIEGFGVLKGSTSWKNNPFESSTSGQFNPSMVGVLINFGYRWGR